MADLPLVVHIVGLKNTGKSGLTARLVAELNRRGIRTAVLKHDGCGHFQWDREGTDTARLAAAGSPVTAILSDKAFAVRATEGLQVTLPEIAATFFRGFDLLLVEGHKHERGRKIEVLRKDVSTGPICREEELVATFGDRVFDRPGVPHYTHDQVEALAERLVHLARRDGNHDKEAQR